ncbi:hypothetical protein BGZ49_003115 [Haplosporangium sp. Z 27]|nr:hypothetical protein BGZ49_003115 [Haplosporangium sp. Z 27]
MLISATSRRDDDPEKTRAPPLSMIIEPLKFCPMRQERDLDVHSWLVVVTFMIVIVIVIRPIRIPLPIPSITKNAHPVLPNTATYAPAAESKSKWSNFPYHITLNIATAPVIGVLFLLATKSINKESIRDGIIGEPSSGIEPYAVMILFFSLAYICISLDMTGVFQYAAFWISKRGSGSGQRVFLSFFLLSSAMSGLTSNDVVVLTMTPFLVYYSHAVDLLTPVAFLMAEIQTANIASMALYIGNLTNVVACQAYSISFLEYSAWMLLPCFASIIACYVMLRINFRHEKYIPKVLKSPDVDPRSCLVDPVGAIFGLSVLACSLACLIGTSFAHVSVWTVTGPFALLTLARDVWYDSQGKFKGPQAVSLVPHEKHVTTDNSNAKEDISNIEEGLPKIVISEKSIIHPVSIGHNNLEFVNVASSASSTVSASKMKDEDVTVVSKGSTVPVATTSHSLFKRFSIAFERRLPLLHAIAIRMPWAILPFTFCMFIMVEGLSDSGWIAIFAHWATKIVPNYVAATYAIGFISVLLCNIFNNVPMTILVARILQHPNFIDSPVATPEVIKGCLFALIVGSNLGACTTLISSLAGLMWDSILRSKKSEVGFWNYFRWNMGVMPVVIFVALSIVVIELTIIY